ncbi:hypothetical protein LCL99_10870 [Halomonas denitrificans]|uniref:DUF4870 family protein n=1 Tax=Halomonas TaxID=2745 RepID=UPI001CD73F8F|nr:MULTISPECIES: hypothetical protein [Halomonas]MCA0914869.1 hypothetical protein [Halomonas denitrificans]MCA0974979.1 hypothetical protein [Halomonas denitrificans]
MTRPQDSISRDTHVGHALYVMYLAGLVTGFLTLLIALIVAYVYRKDAPPWLRAHYHYLIRTFWIGLVYGAAAAVLTVLVIGLALPPLLVSAWFVIRCIIGWRALHRRLPPPRVDSWLW